MGTRNEGWARPGRGRLGWAGLACAGVALLVTVVSLLARYAVPIQVEESPYDGDLFVRQAGNLVRTHWLGPFDDLTLAKGGAYPAFIAVTHAVRLPLKVGEQSTWLVAAGCIAAGVWMVAVAAGWRSASMCSWR